jgi:putative lipoprotein
MNGTQSGGVPATARVTGTVTYLQRSALPPTATVRVQLADVSRADAPAAVLAEQRIEAQGRQVPFAFELPYDPAAIDARMTYAVQARIEDGSRLLFINDTRYAVITRGAPTHVEMVLRPVGAARQGGDP